MEAGPHTLNDPLHTQPGRFFSHLVPGGKTMKFIASNPEKVPGGRVVVVAAGQGVGGGSSINCKDRSMFLVGVFHSLRYDHIDHAVCSHHV